ncbi:bifunctional helix-turn-helix domain-containing protein/methylated-DNA--[protein]-cysteine S-methyltransferase [Neptunomonas japonica]|uniref:methylated-DNA--[protein]-cysteine S-methyltransferase n=1 Tax=Neptunomonas japonica JAMM 1380 TaxID=1441457 RepID=A0A7R6SVZ1_9GAMM|nr:methylated-DNA--[protein]-cysteine S-methyltransferase [Neptunomonas japonica]BBB29177.1 AraC family transcriptional regulator, regulatory protein of adaptative response/methylated-DNA-[protein]-cysteine methyltransferase [Neptunomonas japonica JAMM 1380]
MIDQDNMNYTRIAEAIAYIKDNFKEQPSLNEIAAAVNLSPFHFQRLFSDWAGVSPKKFMQYISIEHAKGLLKDQRLSLLDTAYETGLSGTSRLHDLFINIEGMTPGEFKKGGEALQVSYNFAQTPFGQVIVASTEKGVCHMAFEENAEQALTTLKQRFPCAIYHQSTDKFQQSALLIFQKDWQQLDKVKLHLHGTAFQLKVWDSLLKIPKGQLASYGDIATAIGNPKASRAVGTAIGSNPVAFLIPCHRVIQASGNLGGYMWGATRKSAIIGWEASQKAVL